MKKRWKRALALLLVVAQAMALLSVSAYADTSETNVPPPETGELCLRYGPENSYNYAKKFYFDAQLGGNFALVVKGETSDKDIPVTEDLTIVHPEAPFTLTKDSSNNGYWNITTDVTSGNVSVKVTYQDTDYTFELIAENHSGTGGGNGDNNQGGGTTPSNEPQVGDICLRSGPDDNGKYFYRTSLTFNWQYTPNCQFYIKGTSNNDTPISEQPTFEPDDPNTAGTITISPSSASNTWMFQASAPVKGKLVFAQAGKGMPIEATIEYPAKDEIVLRVTGSTPWYVRPDNQYGFDTAKNNPIHFALVKSGGNGNDNVLTPKTAVISDTTNFKLEEESGGFYVLTATTPGHNTDLTFTMEDGTSYVFHLNTYTSGGSQGGGSQGGTQFFPQPVTPEVGKAYLRNTNKAPDGTITYQYYDTLSFNWDTEYYSFFVIKAEDGKEDTQLEIPTYTPDPQYAGTSMRFTEASFGYAVTASGVTQGTLTFENHPSLTVRVNAYRYIPPQGVVSLRIDLANGDSRYENPYSLIKYDAPHSLDICLVQSGGQGRNSDTVLNAAATITGGSGYTLTAGENHHYTLAANGSASAQLSFAYQDQSGQSATLSPFIFNATGSLQPSEPTDPNVPVEGRIYFKSEDSDNYMDTSAYSANEPLRAKFYVYDGEKYVELAQDSTSPNRITNLTYVCNTVYDPADWTKDMSDTDGKYVKISYDEDTNVFTFTPQMAQFGMFEIEFAYNNKVTTTLYHISFTVPEQLPENAPVRELNTSNAVAPVGWQQSETNENQQYTYFSFTPSATGYYKLTVTAQGQYSGRFNFNCSLSLCGDGSYISKTNIYNDTDANNNGIVAAVLTGNLQRNKTYTFRYSCSDSSYHDFAATMVKTLDFIGINDPTIVEFTPDDGDICFGLPDGTHTSDLQFSDNYTLVTLDQYNATTKSYTTITPDTGTLGFYPAGGLNQEVGKDDGTFVTIEEYGDDFWKISPAQGGSGSLKFQYQSKDYSLGLNVQPKNGPGIYGKVNVLDNSTNELTISTDDSNADYNDIWSAAPGPDQDRLYAYVSYTPKTTGYYKITAKAQPKVNEQLNAGIEICDKNASAQLQTMGENNDEEWVAACTCKLEAGTEYTFRILADPTKLGDVTVTAKTATADETLPGPQDFYVVPDPGWPNAGTATNDKILHYTSGMEEVNVAAKTEGSEDKYLVSRGKDWNVVYVTYTPDHDGIYKLAINSKDGYTYNPSDPVMPQTFRVVQSALWANGGCQFNTDHSIQLADYYQLKAGVTYQFQLLLCKHGIDFTKELNFSITEDVLPLNAKNVFEGDRSTVNSTVDGFYSEEKNTKNVVVNAVENTQGQAVTTSNVTITAAAAVTISEGQVDSATIQTNVADVKFDDTAIDKIGAEPKDSSLVISQSTDEKAVTKTVELTMTQENQPLLPEETQENNGTITVTVPYSSDLLEDGDTVEVLYVRKDGTREPVKATYDAKSQTVTFTTTHFSTYEIHTVKDVCHGNHSYGEWVTKDATCTEDGSSTRTCTVCNKTESETIPATGHTWGNWTTDKAATCTTDKTELRECATCHTQEHRTVENTALGHDFTDYKSDGNATCTKDGTKTAKCSRCDATDTKPDSGSKKDHSWGEYKSNSNATCTEDGTKTRECTVCHTKQTVADTGSKLGHDYKDRVCTRCGAWESACDGGETCPTHGYTDVDQALWYHDYVDFVVANGVMTGTCAEPLRFEPESILTRAQMVEALWKLEGKPQVDKAPAFTDVKKDDWFYASLSWAYSIDLAQGVGNDLFQPDAKLTREQMVTFLYRYAKYKGLDVTAAAIPGSYTDASDVSKYAREPFAWAIEHEIVQGMTSTTLMPQGQSKRSFLAKILTQYLKLAA